jgi:hypothetical protein
VALMTHEGVRRFHTSHDYAPPTRLVTLGDHDPMLDAILGQAIERGELRADLDLEALDAMPFGAILARATLGERLDRAWVERVVATAWDAATGGRP